MNKRGNAKAHTGSSMKTLTAEQRFDDLKSLLDANAPQALQRRVYPSSSMTCRAQTMRLQDSNGFLR